MKIVLNLTDTEVTGTLAFLSLTDRQIAKNADKINEVLKSHADEEFDITKVVEENNEAKVGLAVLAISSALEKYKINV